MNILQINASVRRDANSTRVADAIAARLQTAHPDARLNVRDLAQTPHPILDEAALGALFTPAAERTPEQAARVALDDALIAEVQATDVIVLGVPMYNLGVPVQLKSWIDAISRAGFKLGLALDDGVIVGADKAVLEVGLLARIDGQIGRPLFLCLGIAKGHYGLTHGECSYEG